MSDNPEHPPAPDSPGPSAEVTAAAAAEFKPTPVRVMAAAESDSVQTDRVVEEASFELEGAFWSVRVLGRAGGGSASTAPLLLLGFWPGPEVQGDPVREHMVVGRSLDAMSQADLREAFSRARPWQAPAKAKKGPDRQRGDRPDGATRRRRT
jgi:hypothetical protein